VRSVERDVRLLMLAACAGCADGWSYFGLGHAICLLPWALAAKTETRAGAPAAAAVLLAAVNAGPPCCWLPFTLRADS
jgi:hypothetical protein